MKKALWAAMILCVQSAHAQVVLPDKEAFVNAVSDQIVDSSFSLFLLLDLARPCDFKRYDYDEWLKYGFKEDVPIEVLNELARKSYLDTTAANWVAQRLTKARCISEDSAAFALDPVRTLQDHQEYTEHKKKRLMKLLWKQWYLKPPQDRTVFYISKPEFSDDGQYAVLSVVYRCDNKFCGRGTTYVFHRTGPNWKIAAQLVSWGN